MARVTAAEDADAIAPDPRREAAIKLSQRSGAVLSVIEGAFSGLPLLSDSRRVASLVASASEIHDQWDRVRDGFLSIGRKLLQLDVLLTGGEIDAFRREHGRILPFSHTVGVQLRQVALAVDGGRIPAELCPHGYSTAYQLAVMGEDELHQAQRAGLMRPDVTRARVIAFRRSYATSLDGAPAHSTTGDLESELERLLEERRRSLARLVDIRRRINEIRSQQQGAGHGMEGVRKRSRCPT